MIYPKYVDNLICQPLDFIDKRHGDLFEIIRKEIHEGRPVSPIDLEPRVTDMRGIGFLELYQMFEAAPNSSVTMERQAETLVELSRKRAMGTVSAALSDTVANTPISELDAALETHIAALEEISSRSSRNDNISFARMIEESYEQAISPVDRNVINTGWQELDDYLNGGLRPGQLTILGARPATGKSAVAACMAVANHTQGVGFFSLEMPYQEMTNRMVSIETGIKLSDITQRRLDDDARNKFNAYIQDAPSWKVSIEDKPRRSIAQMRATVKAWKREHDVKLVIVDYLQLMAPADQNESRERQVSRISEDLKAMAKDLHVAVVALAQVNRGSTQRDDKRPTMSDLRESGGIEANADSIILLHRDAQSTDPDEMSKIEFIVAKNRHGQTGIIELVWRPEYSSVNSAGLSDTSYRFGLGKG